CTRGAGWNKLGAWSFIIRKISCFLVITKSSGYHENGPKKKLSRPFYNHENTSYYPQVFGSWIFVHREKQQFCFTYQADFQCKTKTVFCTVTSKGFFSTGTITCLQFYGESHLLSGGEDGLMCVWSTKKWECLKSIKAHKGHVTSLSVHPSGKLALSVGTDKTLR
uniref:Uncharacterized protein n=1 Tax=Oryzias sinensis TaxID=183150 RepID=A0A8C7X6I3_9TELE